MEQQKEMNEQEAINIVAQVCAQYKGTMQEHQMIQRALMILTPKPVVKEPIKEEPKVEKK